MLMRLGTLRLSVLPRFRKWSQRWRFWSGDSASETVSGSAWPVFLGKHQYFLIKPVWRRSNHLCFMARLLIQEALKMSTDLLPAMMPQITLIWEDIQHFSRLGQRVQIHWKTTGDTVWLNTIVTEPWNTRLFVVLNDLLVLFILKAVAIHS